MKKFFVLFFSIVVLGSCTGHKLGYSPDASVCISSNSLLTLPIGPSKIYVSDYVMEPHVVDSVSSESEWVAVSLSADKQEIDVYCGQEMKPMSYIALWVDGVPYAIPVRKSDKINYTFTYDPQTTAPKRVQIAGQMNNWVASMTPDLTLRSDGLYAVDLYLSPGTYLYQMLIDGEQNHDMNNPAKVDNGFGKFNSIMQVPGFEEKFPKLSTHKVSKCQFTIDLEGDVERIWIFWNNQFLDSSFVSLAGDKLTVYVPEEAVDYSKSEIHIWASNSYGISNEILVPIYDGAVVVDAEKLDRHDKYAQIMYFLLVDRFKNGSKENDHPMNRPDVKQKADYQGGDLAGIKQEIDSEYFQRLGVNTLWISPLNQNPLEPFGYNAVADTKFAGYHGYWPVSSSKVDFRFGSNDELKDLVEDAHNHDINILLDYVANHVHEEHPLYVSHPEYATPMYLPDGRLNIELWDEQRLTTWFDTFMPSLDYSNPEVVDMMVDSAMFWVTEFGIDGFRHDACKHVSEVYWRELTHRLKQNDPKGNFYQIGETYGSPELIASYVNSGMLNGQFDFNVYDEAVSAFNGVSGGTLTRLSSILASSIKSYGVHNLMGYISGNHDKPRFMALASHDIAVGEDAKVAGWTREIGITDSLAYDKLALLHTFNLTIPGVPVIYYGDEIGMTGGNDPDCRRMMRFDGWNRRESELFNHVAALSHFRRDNMALVYGDYRLLQVSDSTIVYMRKYFDNEVMTFINNSSVAVEYSLALSDFNFADKQNYSDYCALFEYDFAIKDDTLTIQLPAYSSELIYR